MRKKLFVGSIIVLVTFTVLILIIIKGLSISAILKVINEDNESYIFYTGEIYNFNVKVVINRSSLQMIKSFEISKESYNPPRVLTYIDKKYIVISNEKAIKVFSSTGKLLSTKSVEEGPEGKKIVSSCVSDIDNDLTDEILIILGDYNSEYGNELVIYSWEDGLKEIFREALVGMNPWKVQTSDVDGDGNKEISIAMYKESPFHPVMAKRPYIYDWVEGSIFPKWRGSRLSKPFKDYVFVDIDDDGLDELVSIEILQNGNKVINSYKWKGFGFEGLLESNEYKDIIRLVKGNTGGGQIYIQIKENDRLKWIELKYNNNGFIEGYVNDKDLFKEVIN